MPRDTTITRRGFIPIPKDMDRLAEKIEIIASGETYDVTNYIISGSGTLNRIATEGLSNFSFDLDNGEGRYKGKFNAGNIVQIYYDFKQTATTLRFRGYIDGAFDNFNLEGGWTITIEGRDAPKSGSNEHFADTHITIQFVARNNLDCWFGTTGDTDDEGNYEDGVLYNSGLILEVYDTSDNSWKVYKDLSSGQKTTLKAQAGYTQTHTNTYVEKSRLTISKELANEGDYDFRIYYNTSDSKSYLRVHPEEGILNSSEHVTAGQNLLGISRFGKNYQMYHRLLI